MESFRVLQCGYSKSGNYLCFRILSGILRQHGRYRSFMAASGIGALMDAFCGETKRMPEGSRIDNVKLEGERWFLQFPHPRCRFVPVERELLLAVSSFVWTHEPPTAMTPYEERFSHRFYILRDGRDVVNSALHYLVTPAILKLYPDHRYRSVEEIYADLDFFASKVRAWRDHVRSYLKRREAYHAVRFERLVADRSGTIAELAERLGLEADVEGLAAEIEFGAMQREAPRHLRRGEVGDWKRYFGPDHRSLFRELAGAELIALGYEASDAW